MSSSQMSGATTSPLKPPHPTFFRVLPGKLGELVCAAGSPPGDRVLLQPPQGFL